MAEPRRLMLPGLILFLLAWDLWAVLQDQRPSATDTVTIPALHLHRWIADGTGPGWHEALGPKGPVAPLLGLLLLYLVGHAPLALRLLSVFCHAMMAWQCHHLGRSLAGPRAGLWAALICATQPLVFGWCRLDFREPLLTVMLLGALQLMLRVRLDRWGPALLLGAYLGLGLMTKLTFVVFMAAPGIWFVATRVRAVGHLPRLAGLVAVMIGVTLPWSWPIMQEVLVTYPGLAAASAGDSRWAKVAHYAGLPGVAPLFLAALAAAPALLLSRSLRRGPLALLVSAFLFSTLCFGLLFDVWSRYIVPIFPLASLLCALALDRIQARLGATPARALGAVGAAVLLALFVGINLTGLRHNEVREGYMGMLTPDGRPYRGYPLAARALLPHGPEVLVIRDTFQALSQTYAVEDLWYFNGVKLTVQDDAALKDPALPGKTVSVLLIRQDSQQPLTPGWVDEQWPPPDPHHHDLSLPTRWFVKQADRQHLRTARDPTGVTYSAFRVTAR